MTPGTMLASRYELLRQLGRGGMGQVWLAVDHVLGREVAVKVVDLDSAQDPVAADRFRREARATAALSHDNVVTVFDSGTDGSMAYLVMQLLPGPTLEDLLRDRGSLPLDEALALAEQTAAALAAAHRVGIVHRDIKPGNLMFDDQGRLKVVDFGIARLTESVSAQLTAASTVVGSAAYMAPEQASGEPATPATDLYALGCVLTALLTGRPPFEAEHPLAILQQHLASPPPRVRDRRPDVPEEVDRLVDRMLAKAAEERPLHADEVRERLAALRTGTAGHTLLLPVERTLPMPTALLPGVPVAASESATTTVLTPAASRSPAAAKRQRRRPDWRILAAVGGALVLALLLPFLISSVAGDAGSESAAPTATESQAAESQAADSPAALETAAPDPATEAPVDEAPAEPAPAEPAPAAPADTSLPEALAGLRAAVESTTVSGDEKSRDDLLDGVEEIEEAASKDDARKAARKLDDLERSLDRLERDAQVSSEGAAAIRQAIAQVRDALPE